MSDRSNYKIVAIGGMISVGKSTQVKKLSSLIPNSEIVWEIEKTDDLTHLMLDWHHGSKSPTASTLFQVHFLTNCFLNHRNKLFAIKPETEWVFLDRTILEHEMFTKYYKGIDIDVYKNMWEPAWEHYIKRLKLYNMLPDLYILLDADISVLFNRLVARNRLEEMSNYQQMISSFVRTSNLYISKMTKILDKHNIKYKVIDTNNLSTDEVFNIIKQAINYKEDHNETN